MNESRNTPGEEAKNAYTVKSGDTLSKIAKER
jgi:LysM repeat protein